MELNVSLSALKPSQYRPYLKSWKPNPALMKIFEKISGKTGRKAMRIYFDVGHNVIKNADVLSTAPQPINDYLAEKKIAVLDYFAGVGRDSHGRAVRLGKALAKDPELKRMFDSDPNRKVVAQEAKAGRLVCISMHPYDIVGMSTDRGWVSCMDIVDGVNKHYVKAEVKTGTLIAYLIDANDKNINKPIARCLLKPFFDINDARPKVGKKGAATVYLADRAYPDKNATFVLQVQDWVDQNINKDLSAGKTTLDIALPSKLYDDMNRDEIRYDASKTAAENDEPSYSELRMRQEARNNPDDYAQKIAETEYTDRIGDFVSRMSKDFFPFVHKILSTGWGGMKFLEKVNHDIVNMGIFENPKEYDRVKKMYLEYVTKNLSSDQLITLALDSSHRPDIALPMLDAANVDDSTAMEFLDKVVMYKGHNVVEGGYVDALSEIWSLASDMGNADRVFWRQASYVGYNGSNVERVMEDEYGRYGREDLVAALISLYYAKAKQDDIPVMRAPTLEQCEDVVRDEYVDYALPIMRGMTPIKIATGIPLSNKVVSNEYGFDRKTLKRAKDMRYEMKTGITLGSLESSSVLSGLDLTFVDAITSDGKFFAFFVKETIPYAEYSQTIKAIEKALILQYLEQSAN